jgi:TPP-dependent pyruvate/acetoin dehydrogenase alpha subunit
MAKLKITRADGSVTEHKITPSIEYAFELYAKMVFIRRLEIWNAKAMSTGLLGSAYALAAK